MSHIKLWTEIAESNVDHVLVLEDDVIICTNFKYRLREIEDKYSRFYDMIFIGTGDHFLGNVRRMVAPGIYEPRRIRRGMYAYLITKRGALNVLRHFQPVDLSYGGIDTAVGKMIRKGIISGIACHPSLCVVNSVFESNIYNPLDPDKPLHWAEVDLQ